MQVNNSGIQHRILLVSTRNRSIDVQSDSNKLEQGDLWTIAELRAVRVKSQTRSHDRPQ